MWNTFQLQIILLLMIFSSLDSKFGIAQCLSERDVHPILLHPTQSKIDLSCTQNFSLTLFKEVVPTDPTENFVFSPHSVWNVLVLAYLGSDGETKKQLKEVVNFPDKITTFNMWKEHRYMFRKRTEAYPNSTFLTESRGYFDDGVELRECIVDLLKDDIEQLDFKNNATVSADVINDFISETTRSHLDEIVNPEDLKNAKFALVNAAYFEANWDKPFRPEFTILKVFQTFDNHKLHVPMMTQRNKYKYAVDEDGKFEVVELPYVGKFVSMLIFRPLEINMTIFDEMIDNLTDSKINILLSKMMTTDLHIYLPKIYVESVISTDLIEALTEIGLEDVFSKENTDFSSFTSDPHIVIDQVIQKTVFKAMEEGTVAATGTGWIQPMSLPKKFICDRPFVFLIRDNDSKNILFMGTYKKPAKKNTGTCMGV